MLPLFLFFKKKIPVGYVICFLTKHHIAQDFYWSQRENNNLADDTAFNNLAQKNAKLVKDNLFLSSFENVNLLKRN
jgi:hypothetical protein